jgi:hypothetical protein
MTLRVQQVGTRLLLILALAAALLAGMVAVYWATGQGGSSHGISIVCGSIGKCLKVSVPGGDGGGGRIRTANGGDHIAGS